MAALDEDLFIEQIEIGPMQNFTYIVGSRRTREVALVDPAWDVDALLARCAEQELTPVAALLTHYHPDHCGGKLGGHAIQGVSHLLERVGLKVHVHRLEADGVKKVTGLGDGDLVRVDSGDRLAIGDVEIEFLHTPGHTPGSQCFRCRDTLVSGDTLFIQGCGRVDLPGSDVDEMFRSLGKLRSLPDDTLLLPGHNYSAVPNATLGACKQQNVHLRIDDLATWHNLMGHHG